MQRSRWFDTLNNPYGKADTIEAGIRKAEQIIGEGLALKKLEQFREESQK